MFAAERAAAGILFYAASRFLSLLFARHDYGVVACVTRAYAALMRRAADILAGATTYLLIMPRVTLLLSRLSLRYACLHLRYMLERDASHIAFMLICLMLLPRCRASVVAIRATTPATLFAGFYCRLRHDYA